MRPGRHLTLHVLDPAFEEGRNSHPGGFDGGAFLQLSNQAGAFDLRLPLGAPEAVPTLLALTALRIAHVDDDCPMAGRTFADVAFHFFSPVQNCPTVTLSLREIY